MGMLIKMILIVFVRAIVWADAATGVTDIARSFHRAFELVGESLICRICHDFKKPEVRSKSDF